MTTVLRARRPSVVAVVVLTAALLAPSFAAPPRAQAVVTAPERVMANMINRARMIRGIAPLYMHSSMSDKARAHSRGMMKLGRLFHTRNLAYQLRYYRWRVAGENVGVGSDLVTLFRAFWASYPHRRNIVYGSYRYMGIGIAWEGTRAWVTIWFMG